MFLFSQLTSIKNCYLLTHVFTAVASVLIAISVATVLAILGIIIIVIAVCVVRFKQIDTSKSLHCQAY